MLLDEALDAKEGGKQVPLVSCGIDRIGEVLTVVKRFE